MSAETINGARIVLETLHRLGVTDMFGYPGGAVIPIYDEIYSFPEIKHYFVRHEQGAAHAADGYARATGKTGVVFATSGPGATNLVTGIATAYMDSVPMVAITCNVGTPLLGKDSFQEVDITGIVMPITKHSFIVKDVKKLAKTIRRAFVIAKSGRPGVCSQSREKAARKCRTSIGRQQRTISKPLFSLSELTRARPFCINDWRCRKRGRIIAIFRRKRTGGTRKSISAA